MSNKVGFLREDSPESCTGTGSSQNIGLTKKKEKNIILKLDGGSQDIIFPTIYHYCIISIILWRWHTNMYVLTLFADMM